jgi:microcystin-dependent protein
MDYRNQSSYFKADLYKFILYRNIRTNRIKTFNISTVNLDASNADISYANITNLNVQHDITIQNTPYLPIGIVLPFAGNDVSPPLGWLYCDGSDVSINEYQSLFDVIQNTYGSASTGRFKLPDLRGRVIVGTNPSTIILDPSNNISVRTIGDISGAETHQLTVAEMPSHNHSITDPGHSHNYKTITDNTGSGAIDDAQGSGNDSSTTSSTTGITINSTGGNQPHNNMQPFLVLNYIIKYRV